MTLAEAQSLTLRVLKQVMEEKLDQHNVQLAQVRALSFQRIESNVKVPIGNARRRFRNPVGNQAKGGH